MFKLLLPLALLSPFFLVSCAAQSPAGATDARIADPLLKETSGLAVSPTNPNFLWVINDSGAGAQIHLMDQTGTARGMVSLRGVKNRDWEDMTSFKFKGQAYLLVADVGDNAAQRDFVELHLIEEPILPGSGKSLNLEVKPSWSIKFRYEDGPRDCESIAVDPRAAMIYLLSKRERPTALYQLPFRMSGNDELMIAKRLGTTARIPLPKNSLPHPHGSQPTAMDFSPDGSSAALLTYRGVFLVKRKAGQSWLEAFQEKPTSLGAHTLPQAEALAFDSSGKSVYFTSEGTNPELKRWPVR